MTASDHPHLSLCCTPITAGYGGRRKNADWQICSTDKACVGNFLKTRSCCTGTIPLSQPQMSRSSVIMIHHDWRLYWLQWMPRSSSVLWHALCTPQCIAEPPFWPLNLTADFLHQSAGTVFAGWANPYLTKGLRLFGYPHLVEPTCQSGLLGCHHCCMPQLLGATGESWVLGRDQRWMSYPKEAWQASHKWHYTSRYTLDLNRWPVNLSALHPTIVAISRLVKKVPSQELLSATELSMRLVW